jgi:amino acid permease
MNIFVFSFSYVTYYVVILIFNILIIKCMIIYEGTWVTASAHIVTAVIGSGVLSLAWAVAQLGWIGGTIVLILFSLVTLLTSILMADCYRYPDPIHGKRNPTYMDMVKAILGN